MRQKDLNIAALSVGVQSGGNHSGNSVVISLINYNTSKIFENSMCLPS